MPSTKRTIQEIKFDMGEAIGRVLGPNMYQGPYRQSSRRKLAAPRHDSKVVIARRRGRNRAASASRRINRRRAS